MPKFPEPDHWTTRYFGKLYAELYSQHLLPAKQTRIEADFARRLLQLSGKRVLDLACGFGRHARLLARHSAVVGIDRNREYLAMARENTSGQSRDRLLVSRGDMRWLPLRSECFDAVLLLFNSFGYFVPPPVSAPLEVHRELWKLPRVFYERGFVSEDFGMIGRSQQSEEQSANSAEVLAEDENFLVLKEIARVLRAGGEFLLEVPNPRPLIEAVMSSPRRWLITREYEIEEQFTYDRRRRILSNTTRMTAGKRTEVADYHLKLYSRRELEVALRRVGLKVLSVFGSYDGEPYSAPTSVSILIHARKLKNEESMKRKRSSPLQGKRRGRSE
ncbi:MAG: class I SAM-dependent methyltransferase, partial [Candidatus Sumerlaeaceae bacterium]|nr:class I SAM-dependent methyltransferase [Candidatus Sumerlaeaceae bacterium]